MVKTIDEDYGFKKEHHRAREKLLLNRPPKRGKSNIGSRCDMTFGDDTENSTFKFHEYDCAVRRSWFHQNRATMLANWVEEIIAARRRMDGIRQFPALSEK